MKETKNGQEQGLHYWLFESKFRYLLLVGASLLALFFLLGSKSLWTHEARWALISDRMMKTHDYFHPYLYDEPYYDKPLVSYWTMIACAKVIGKLDEFSMRLPSAVSALLLLWILFGLAKRLFGEETALRASWLLILAPEFLFWCRTATSDILNVCGIMAAVAWYFAKKESPGFLNFLVFFLIMSLTSLMKGLTGFVFPLLIILPDLLITGGWRKLLTPKSCFLVFLSLIPALLLYVAPFMASAVMGGEGYGENGLLLVYQENILRFLKPFDHTGSVFTYFIYAPLYSLPWIFFFIPSIVSVLKNWKQSQASLRWLASSFILLFIFLTASGSRRSYYILPLVPLMVLLVAAESQSRKRLITRFLGVMMVLTLLWISAGTMYDSFSGVNQFAEEVRKSASGNPLKLLMFHPHPKTAFYLVKNADQQWVNDFSSVAKIAEIVKEKPETVVVTSERYAGELSKLLPGARMICEKPNSFLNFSTETDPESGVAFVMKR